MKKSSNTVHNLKSKCHSFRAFVHANRGNIQNKKKLTVKLSSKRCRTKIINYANTITESVPEVKYAYADVTSKLKVCLLEQREGKYILSHLTVSACSYQMMMYLMMKMFHLEVARNTLLFICNLFSFSCFNWFIIWR